MGDVQVGGDLLSRFGARDRVSHLWKRRSRRRGPAGLLLAPSASTSAAARSSDASTRRLTSSPRRSSTCGARSSAAGALPRMEVRRDLFALSGSRLVFYRGRSRHADDARARCAREQRRHDEQQGDRQSPHRDARARRRPDSARGARGDDRRPARREVARASSSPADGDENSATRSRSRRRSAPDPAESEISPG